MSALDSCSKKEERMWWRGTLTVFCTSSCLVLNLNRPVALGYLCEGPNLDAV